MTEKKGGSDVKGSTETTASWVSGNQFSLEGYKWFASAVDSEIALVLAKIKDKNEVDEAPSLFLVQLRDQQKNLN